MILAWKDIRFNFARFVLAVVGLTAILTMSLAMNGLYRGIVHESLVMAAGVGADAWLVQGGRDGPFNDESHVSSLLDRRAEGLFGVKEARRFLSFSFPVSFGSHKQRLSIFALDFPKDKGDRMPLAAGRYLESPHFEMIVDKSTGLALGERIRIGRDDYTVVGVTRGQVDMAGDGLIFVSLPDAQSILNVAPSEAILLARASSRNQTAASAFAAGSRPIMAVILTLEPGAPVDLIREKVASWGDVTMITRAEQIDLVIQGRLRRLRLQILLFVGLMYAISGAIVSLTIFTIVLEKLHAISLLKLIGASDAFISLWILQYGLILGSISYGLAVAISLATFDLFPRAVILEPSDALLAGLALLVVCAFACTFSIRKALSVRAREILS
ncbi:ABC transporter permease [Methylocapsa acidiphila]|uniref:ABC transporter permease n=1 Tax=Methylocapsa acidiphila TaxID=133552 RepID=UPI0003FC4E03|nr:ABC transporter permease [Methylocapsa acidiphila]